MESKTNEMRFFERYKFWETARHFLVGEHSIGIRVDLYALVMISIDVYATVKKTPFWETCSFREVPHSHPLTHYILAVGNCLNEEIKMSYFEKNSWP